MTHADILAMPVEDLDLTVGSWKTLKRNAIRTVWDLTHLVKQKNWATLLLRCGRRSVWEISSALAKRGLADQNLTMVQSGYPQHLLTGKGNNPQGMLLISQKLSKQYIEN